MNTLSLIIIDFFNTYCFILALEDVRLGLCFIYYDIRDKHDIVDKSSSLMHCILREVLDTFFLSGIVGIIIMCIFLAYLLGLISIDTYRIISIMLYLIGGFINAFCLGHFSFYFCAGFSMFCIAINFIKNFNFLLS